MQKKNWRDGLDWDVFVQDKYTCQYCGITISALDNRWDLFAADHPKPQARGGKDTVMNLVTACVGCNALKSRRARFDWAYDRAEPETEEEQKRIVEVVKGYIKVHREKLVADCIAMQRDAGLL
jgi:5-methylcytosine-specific restriction endonuclease McrA